MARIVGVDIPRNKKITYSLCYIHGIGLSTAVMICNMAKIDIEKRVQDLTEKQIVSIREAISSLGINVEGELRSFNAMNIKRLKDESLPFFLTAGFISNHLPFVAPKRFWDMYEYDSIILPTNQNPAFDAPKISISKSNELRSGYLDIPKKGDLSQELSKKLTHGYYATVSYVDHLVGKIIKTLKDEGIEKNTIIIFVSDHGFNLKEHSQWGKYTSHRISGRVPLIIYDPRNESNTNSNSLVELVDIYPTVIELLGLNKPNHKLEGKSIVNILKLVEKIRNLYLYILLIMDAVFIKIQTRWLKK